LTGFYTSKRWLGLGFLNHEHFHLGKLKNHDAFFQEKWWMNQHGFVSIIQIENLHKNLEATP